MHRPHRTRRTIRRYLRAPLVRFTIGALVVAIAVGIVFAATDTATALPAYLRERPAESLGAFWAVVALGICVAFSAAAVGVLRRLEQADR
jgi:uncharacterized membrane protein